MAIDGITIKAIVKELKSKLIGGRLQKIYQINDHLILLNIYNNKENHKLLISSNPQNARIHFTKAEYDTPQKPPQFAMILRKHIQNSIVKDVRQNDMDRSIEIDLFTKDDLGFDTIKKLTVEIMGKHSNIVLTNKDNKVIESIKRISHEMSSVRAVYPGTTFTKLEDNKINILNEHPDLSELEIEGKQNLRKIFYMNFTGFGPQIGNEIAFLANLEANRSFASLEKEELDRLNDAFHSVIDKIKSEDFTYTLYYDNDNNPIEFYPIELQHINSDKRTFDSVSEILDIYYSQNVNDNSLNQAKGNLANIISDKIQKYSNKLENLNADLLIAKEYDKYRIEGDLLSPIAHTIKRGLSSITVNNYYTGEDIKIDLDPRKNSWDNIELKYKKSKKLHRSFDILQKSIPNLEEDLSYLNDVLRQINIAEDSSDLEDIKDELRDLDYIKNTKSKKKNKKSEEVSTYHKYLTKNNNYIFVGKNNKQNEELTLRIANPDDLFFHIKDLPGSHVILKKGQEIKDFEIDAAAYLAAKYSKNGSDRYIDVDYTEKKHVNKAKGSKPGMVYYTNYKTLRVDLEEKPDGINKV